QRLDARREQQQRRRGRARARRGDVAEQVRVAQPRRADEVEADVALGEASRPAADRDDLAAGARARPWQAPALQLEDLRQAVDRGDLDEPAVDAQLAEEDDSPDLTGGERAEHAPNREILAPVRLRPQRQPEAIDPEAARVGGQRGETLVERLLPRDEAAADDGDGHREGERDAADDERGAQRAGAQPRRRDAKRRPGRAAHHRRTAYTGVARSPE